MHNQEKVFSQRQAEYEYQIHSLNAEIEVFQRETQQMKEELKNSKNDIQVLERARDSFKTQFMELKEINKDLKAQFKQIESQLQSAISTQKENQVPPQQKVQLMGEIKGLIQDYREKKRTNGY